MSRHFTLPTVLKMTPNNLLQHLFLRLGQPLACIDWLHLRDRHYEPLMFAINNLSREARQKIESTLAAVFELACEKGWLSILNTARQFGDLEPVHRFPDNACNYTRALWTWLNRPEIFDQALLMLQVDELPRMRKRTGLPLLKPRITSNSIRELGLALSACLRREEGRGQNCTVLHCRRSDGADVFVAYPDDFVRTVMAHDASGRLIPRSAEQTFEIVFVHQAETGTLEMFAKVAPLVRPKLEILFGQIILGADLSPRPHIQPFDLNRLKDRYFCLETDPEDRLSVFIRRLRLDIPDRGRVAETCAEGAHKYGDFNWQKGIPASQMLNHAIRHIYLWLEGDNQEDHLAHAAWNILGVCHFEEVLPEMIDVPARKEVPLD